VSDAYIPSIHNFRKNISSEAGDSFAFPVYNPDLLNLISLAPDERQKSHPLGDVESATPEIDDVAARMQSRCFLDIPAPDTRMRMVSADHAGGSAIAWGGSVSG